MIRATWRTCRKHRRCECGRVITPGERYIDHVMSPYHDTIGGETWQRAAECVPCATRYGRAGSPSEDTGTTPGGTSDG